MRNNLPPEKVREYNQRYYKANPEKLRALAREYYYKHREKNLERRKKYQITHKKEIKDRRLKWAYGLEKGLYDQMVERQNGLCAVCGRKPDNLYVDHCHDTGVVRGLLCRQCNSALGLLQESSEVVQNAVNYLNRWKEMKEAA